MAPGMHCPAARRFVDAIHLVPIHGHNSIPYSGMSHDSHHGSGKSCKFEMHVVSCSIAKQAFTALLGRQLYASHLPNPTLRICSECGWFSPLHTQVERCM